MVALYVFASFEGFIVAFASMRGPRANIVGYTLSVPDNGTFMFRDKSSRKRCPTCGYAKTFLQHNPDYTISKREADYKHDGYFEHKADFSSTYDLYDVVSERFRQFCLSNGYTRLVFREFKHDKNHYYFMAERTIKFDAVTRGVVFEKLCPECKNYESVVGATPSYLIRSRPLRDGFYRTDLLFGSGDRKRPNIIVGPETRAKLKLAKLHGLTFSPAYGTDR